MRRACKKRNMQEMRDVETLKPKDLYISMNYTSYEYLAYVISYVYTDLKTEELIKVES